jgi:Zn-dependent protease
MLIFAGFGWAKPVPVNPYYFQGSRTKKMMWVAGAGPLSNLAQALIISIFFSLLVHFVPMSNSTFATWLFKFLNFFIIINIVLAVFNLLPVPPLDGSKILAGLLPERHMNIIFVLDRYGFIILIVMVLFGLTGKIIFPIVDLLHTGILRLVGFR